MRGLGIAILSTKRFPLLEAHGMRRGVGSINAKNWKVFWAQCRRQNWKVKGKKKRRMNE